MDVVQNPVGVANLDRAASAGVGDAVLPALERDQAVAINPAVNLYVEGLRQRQR